MGVDNERFSELDDQALVRRLGKAKRLACLGVTLSDFKHGHGGLAQLKELLLDAVLLPGRSHGCGHGFHSSSCIVSEGGRLH
jgi:hypothetical protein